jgi:hypothetical protein
MLHPAHHNMLLQKEQQTTKFTLLSLTQQVKSQRAEPQRVQMLLVQF